jgi:hypothetical protein
MTISDTPETTKGRIQLLFGSIAMFTIIISAFDLATRNKDIMLWI